MRMYASLPEAISEIRRDVYNGQKVEGTRVQQKVGDFKFIERLSYSYGIEGRESAWPENPEGLILLGQAAGFRYFVENPKEMLDWLYAEAESRLIGNFGEPFRLTELMHPALKSTLEGQWPSYTYTDRLNGAMDAMVNALVASVDTRRAYWPIFRPEDSLRAPAPTRIPCSLGYQALVRETDLGPLLYFIYLERSADFDTFWLTDIWFARQFQEALVRKLVRTDMRFQELKAGPVFHQIISFHSFEILGTEVY